MDSQRFIRGSQGSFRNSHVDRRSRTQDYRGDPKRAHARNEVNIGIDTSCLVPLVSSWHEHHDATLSSLEELKRQNHTLIVATHAVLECFSVLTRLPERIRITPREASERL